MPCFQWPLPIWLRVSEPVPLSCKLCEALCFNQQKHWAFETEVALSFCQLNASCQGFLEMVSGLEYHLIRDVIFGACYMPALGWDPEAEDNHQGIGSTRLSTWTVFPKSGPLGQVSADPC